MVNSSYNEIEIEIEVYKEKKKEERSIKKRFQKTEINFFFFRWNKLMLWPLPIAATATLDKLDRFISLIFGAGLVAVVLTFNS